MKPKHSWLANAILPFGLIIIICLTSIATAQRELSEAQKQLDDNDRKWTSKSIKNYRYTFHWRCFCMPEYVKPVIISVRDGMIDQIKYAEGGAAIDKSNYAKYKTIEGLFDFIRDGINRRAYQIKATYDIQLGYPSYAFIDYSARTADEEMGFEAKDLTVVERK